MGLDNLKDNPKLVLALFRSEWCSTCKMLHPIVEQVARQFPDQIDLRVIDAVKDSALAAEYEVLGIPAILVFKDGTIINRYVGFISKDQLIKNLNLADK